MRLINQLQKVCCILGLVIYSFWIWIFGNFFKFVTLTLSCVHVMWMLKLIPNLSFYCSHFWFSMMIPLDDLLNISSGFDQNYTFLFLAFFFSIVLFTPQPGGVLSSRSGRAGGRVGGCQTCGTHISVTAWRIFSIQSSVELSRPVVVHCHGRLPICPIWTCPWAKNLSNLPQIGSRLCGTHVSETVGWI